MLEISKNEHEHDSKNRTWNISNLYTQIYFCTKTSMITFFYYESNRYNYNCCYVTAAII